VSSATERTAGRHNKKPFVPTKDHGAASPGKLRQGLHGGREGSEGSSLDWINHRTHGIHRRHRGRGRTEFTRKTRSMGSGRPPSLATFATLAWNGRPIIPQVLWSLVPAPWSFF